MAVNPAHPQTCGMRLKVFLGVGVCVLCLVRAPVLSTASSTATSSATNLQGPTPTTVTAPPMKSAPSASRLAPTDQFPVPTIPADQLNSGPPAAPGEAPVIPPPPPPA